MLSFIISVVKTCKSFLFKHSVILPIDIVEIIVSYCDENIIIGLSDIFPRLMSDLSVGYNDLCIQSNLDISIFLLTDIKCWKYITMLRLHTNTDYQVIKNRTRYINSMGVNEYHIMMKTITSYGYNILNSDNLPTSDGFRYFSNLRTLVCDASSITDQDLIHLKNLESLWCEDCQSISDQGIKHLTKLEYLSCSFTNISNHGILYLKNLESLTCEGCRYIDDDGIQGMTKLKRLDCTDTDITNQGIKFLVNLELLECSGTCINTNGMRHLEHLTSVYCDKKQIKGNRLRGVNVFTMKLHLL